LETVSGVRLLKGECNEEDVVEGGNRGRGCSDLGAADCGSVRQKQKADEIEGIVKMVAAFYKGCENPEASTIMAELAVCDMADKGQCDAIPELEANLARLKNPALKNFTRFLISDQAKKKGDKDRQLAELRKVMEENAQ
jgi:hypothetical protein